MFALSTAHVALALNALLQGFVYQRGTGGPETFFRQNVFPSRKAIYIINVRYSILFSPLLKIRLINISCRLSLEIHCWFVVNVAFKFRSIIDLALGMARLCRMGI